MAVGKGLKVGVILKPTGKAGFREWRQIVRQFPFAMKETLNDLAIAFQKQQREWQERIFNIIKKGYFHRAVKYANQDRPSVKNLVSEIHIDAKGSDEIFQRQELGGTRKPHRGSSVAIPQEDVRRTGKGAILKREYPNRLKNKFEVAFASGKRALFVRTGRRQKAFTQGVTAATRSGALEGDPNVQFKYWLTPSAEIDPALDFFTNANAVFVRDFDRFMGMNLDEAFASIKPARR